MKKRQILWLIVIAGLLLIACNERTQQLVSHKTSAPTAVTSTPKTEANPSTETDAPATEQPTVIPSMTEEPNPTAFPSESSQANTSDRQIDVDLTQLSSTMVYAEVYNMMTSPETYIGKIVKMDGTFAYYHDKTTDQYYFACLIQDATACCSQGIEFVLTDDYSYPDDYPEAGNEICVIGIFDTYQEGSNTYCTLRNAEFVG